jgi:importin-5
MSLLPPAVHAELNQLLQALQSSDNNIRSQAEDHLANSWTATRPEQLLMGLAEQLAASPDASVGAHESLDRVLPLLLPPLLTEVIPR